MAVIDTPVNRRMKRSDDIQTALTYQLSATADQAKFNAVVLADEHGLVMARAGHKGLCEQIAALSPVLASDMKAWHGAVGSNVGRVQLSVAPLRVEGSQFYISAVAGRKSDITRALYHGGRGISRILH